MKRIQISLLVVVFLAFAAHARAATVVFSATAFVNVNLLSTTGTLVDAAHFGTGVDPSKDIALNGINFVSQSVSTPCLTVGSSGGTASLLTNTCQAGFHTIAGMTSAQQDSMFDGAVYGAGNGNSLVTLNTLTIGQTYELQLLMVNDRAANNNITVQNDPSGGAVGPLDFSQSQVRLVTGSFTADATTQKFRIATSAGLNAELNAYQLRNITPVPEPSVALLGGLGALALLRRRRI